MLDERGRRVAEPLFNGVRFCRLHLQLFCARPTIVEDALVFYLDFETTGLDVLRHHIVEIGVVCENSACFSTVARPPAFSDGPMVHGLLDEELKEGPAFKEAFHRMYSFCENLAAIALNDDDSSCDEVEAPTLRDHPPKIVICAHNGTKFDFPFLCSECIRNDLDIGKLGQWCYADTIEVFRAIDGEMHGGCVKLQCLLRSLAPTVKLNAHRALDDCVALQSVLGNIAAALGVSSRALLKPFVVELDCATTTAHIGMLVD